MQRDCVYSRIQQQHDAARLIDAPYPLDVWVQPNGVAVRRLLPVCQRWREYTRVMLAVASRGHGAIRENGNHADAPAGVVGNKCEPTHAVERDIAGVLPARSLTAGSARRVGAYLLMYSTVRRTGSHL